MKSLLLILLLLCLTAANAPPPAPQFESLAPASDNDAPVTVQFAATDGATPEERAAAAQAYRTRFNNMVRIRRPHGYRSGRDNLYAWDPTRRTTDRVGLALGRVTVAGAPPGYVVKVLLLDWDRHSWPDALGEVWFSQIGQERDMDAEGGHTAVERVRPLPPFGGLCWCEPEHGRSTTASNSTMMQAIPPKLLPYSPVHPCTAKA